MPPRRYAGTVPSHARDELLDALVDGAERVLAQHGALRLVVELEVHPVDREVPAALLGPPDELAAEAGAGGLRRDGLRLEDLDVRGDPLGGAVALQEVEQAPVPRDVVIRQV